MSLTIQCPKCGECINLYFQDEVAEREMQEQDCCICAYPNFDTAFRCMICGKPKKQLVPSYSDGTTLIEE